MHGRVRGGAGAMAADMEIDVDISTISDADILNEIKHRRLGLQVVSQYDFIGDLPAVPDASSPQASLPYINTLGS